MVTPHINKRLPNDAPDDASAEDVALKPYTVSLDTMRLIEDLIPTEKETDYVNALRLLVDDRCRIGRLVFATAAQRARAAVKVLGLEE